MCSDAEIGQFIASTEGQVAVASAMVLATVSALTALVWGERRRRP